MIQVSVQSTGPLVPEKDVVNIFSRGFRADAAKKITSQGSGLGLYIAKIVSEAHGFQIHYDSKENKQQGRGENIFWFNIPPDLVIK